MTDETNKQESPKAEKPKVTKAERELQDAQEYFRTFRKVPPGYRFNVNKGVYKAEVK